MENCEWGWISDELCFPIQINVSCHFFDIWQDCMPSSLCPKFTFESAGVEVSSTQVVKNLQYCESPICTMKYSSIIADVFCVLFNSILLFFLKQTIRTFHCSNINSNQFAAFPNGKIMCPRGLFSTWHVENRKQQLLKCFCSKAKQDCESMNLSFHCMMISSEKCLIYHNFSCSISRIPSCLWVTATNNFFHAALKDAHQAERPGSWNASHWALHQFKKKERK